MSVLATARLLVGRTIVAVDLRPADDCDVTGKKLGVYYDPIFTLDNGARVTFHVQEIDCGDGYGVMPRYHKKEKL